MKNIHIITNKIVEERVKEYCRKIEENKLKNVKATIQIDRNKISINNKKKLYLEKLKNDEIERNNNILKKKLEHINKREKKDVNVLKQAPLQHLSTNKKNFLFENIKKAKIKVEKKKINHVNVNSTLNENTIIKNPKKIVYKGYIDDIKKCYKFYIEVKVDEEGTLNILSLNLKSKKVKKLTYEKEKHGEMLNSMETYEAMVKKIIATEEEHTEQIQKKNIYKKKYIFKERERPTGIKNRVLVDNIEKTCDFYIKKYFNDDFDDINSPKEINNTNDTNTNHNNGDIILKKKKNSFLLMKNELLYKSRINEAQARLIFQKIKEKLQHNPKINFGLVIDEGDDSIYNEKSQKMSIQKKYNKSKKDLKLKTNSKPKNIKLNDTKKIGSNQSKINDVDNTVLPEKKTDQHCDIDNLNKVSEEEATLKTNDVELKNAQENIQSNPNEEESSNKTVPYISNEEINSDHFASHTSEEIHSDHLAPHTSEEINSDHLAPHTSEEINSDHLAPHTSEEINSNEEKESEMNDKMDMHKGNDELKKKTDEPSHDEQIDSETANNPIDINPVKDI
ncbi:conserved Plasmodium protein, unknown function [Plasmodium berghei]|uniref:Uncharacterized protein n=2 Tax=Plasmodium berghei TaxID=5821 RepID=A0A509AGE5_PLABA|nr:conserved Plasmodium protein, unknown function [Plasmodium berghei ANKA]SCL92000.1 conserved Plasmodium protein, unknown function [Plasmodium berghei]SCM15573.1 conserved Plasmodium protein, unknown function [Plasmodium berghei]SCN22608.1 conserved Plasmodium protein, unknown function [Plasmodium berghei]VUC54338.1 conserved Plasmodium protein, unknown function [Plasmodium berghei ANKA]|eukprot:XP_034420171.1 conserved Plasmodium protein, unknown function [Plasmodium berghei ANKA]